jgi:DNA-binding CsgD family transcriptional regulator
MAQLTLMQQFVLNRWVGSPGRFADRLLRHGGPTGSNTIWYAAAAIDAADDGRPDEARLLLRRGVGPSGVERVPTNEFWLFSVGMAAIASDGTDDAERAATIHTLLLPHVDLLVGNVAPIVGPISYAAGLAALAAGRHADAVDLLAHAAQRAERLACWPWVVDALRGEARARQAAGRDHQACTARGDAIARQVGMTATAVGRHDGIEGRLTRRERDVFTLIAAGASNQEIAERLYISYRTAKTHVSHVLAKLGARDRADAAIIARRAGLGG